MRRLLPALLLLVASGIASGADLLSDVTDFADCDTLVLRHPDSLEAHRCYWMLARRTGEYEEAARRLEARRAVDGNDGRVALYLAAVRRDMGQANVAEALYREAVAELEAADDKTGVVYAWLGLVFLFDGQGRTDEGEKLLEKAAAIAEETGDPRLIANILENRGWHAYRRGDYGRAFLVFRELEDRVFPDGSSFMKGNCLSGLGASSWGMSRFAEALEYYRREAAVYRESGDRFAEATALSNSLRLVRLVEGTGETEVVAMIEEALPIFEEVGNYRAVVTGHELLASMTSDPDRKLDHLLTAERISREHGDLHQLNNVLPPLASTLWRRDPQRAGDAAALLDESLEISRRTGNDHGTLRALSFRNQLHWETGSREEAILATLDGLDARERVRYRQSDPTARARFFNRWAGDYYMLSARLLGDGVDVGNADRELAFHVIERLRSRMLLDRLDAADGLGAPTAAARELWEERGAVLRSIAQTQRRLLDPATDEAARSAILDELESLEDRERSLRGEIARSDPRFGRLHRPTLPTLPDVIEALDEDQAVLSYQLSWDGLWSRLVVLTRGDLRVYPMPHREEVARSIGLYLGLLERRDGSEEVPGRALAELLLRRAIDELPAEVERLIVVPDGPLCRLPFAALPGGAAGEPLAARFSLSLAPSVSAWLRLRALESVGGDGPTAFVLADPEGPQSAETSALLRAWEVSSGAPLGALPHARTEAEAVARRLRQREGIRLGAEATERLVKETDLTGFRILHLAAHAVVDDDRPERAAVVLAPGDEAEDGLLQVREIVDLDLEGQVVLLSACRSASGQEVTGEGVLGLAHAFFQAGARTVIGGLWPLRDDEAALFVDDFYAGVAEGLSVAEALTAARRARLAAGTPTAGWAGMVLIGDEEFVPLPGGATRPSWGVAIGGALAALLLASAAVYALRRR